MRRDRGNDWFAIDGAACIRETDKALLVLVPSLKTGNPPIEGWVPKSQLHTDENEVSAPGDLGMLVIPEWLAREKGWFV